MQGQQEGSELFCTFGKCENIALFGTYCKHHQAERAAAAENKLALAEDRINELVKERDALQVKLANALTTLLEVDGLISP